MDCHGVRSEIEESEHVFAIFPVIKFGEIVSLFLLVVFGETLPLTGDPRVDIRVDRGPNCRLEDKPLEDVRGIDLIGIFAIRFFCIILRIYAAGVVSVVLPVEHSVCDTACKHADGAQGPSPRQEVDVGSGAEEVKELRQEAKSK